MKRTTSSSGGASSPDRAATGVHALEQPHRLEEVEPVAFAIQEVRDGRIAFEGLGWRRVDGQVFFVAGHSKA